MLEVPTTLDVATLPVTHEAQIPEDYLDVMGHMNVMWYTYLFDCGVYELFNLIGLDEDYMKSHNCGGFALESHVRHMSEVRVGHHVTIRTRVVGRTEKRFHILHFMTNETEDVLAATCEIVGGHINMSIRRMSPWPSRIAGKLDEMISSHKALAWAPPLCGVMGP